jgi:hypothetical protein
MTAIFHILSNSLFTITKSFDGLQSEQITTVTKLEYIARHIQNLWIKRTDKSCGACGSKGPRGLWSQWKKIIHNGGVMQQGSWLRNYATSRKVAGSIPDEDTWFFSWPNPSSRTMALRSTQPLTEMSIRNLPGAKGRPVHKTDNLTANLWADCLENVAASTSHIRIGLHGLLQE